MREIKFRAWNDAIETLANVIELRFDQHALLTDESKYLWDLNKSSLMQYTGLKDINGIEIYEGDILSDDEYITGAVKYDGDGYFCGDDGRLYDIAYTGEVVGNIYENPDLLEA